MSFTPSQLWKCRSCGALNTTNHAKCVECGDSQVNKLLLSLEPCGDCDPCCAGQPNQCAVPIVAKSSKWPDRDGCDNQLEADWLAHLRMLFCQEPTIQVLVKPFTLRLANRLSYTPDFSVTRTYTHLYRMATVTFYETKGPHRFREKGIIKLKMAAKLHPWATWVLVERENGQWKETVV